MAKTLTKIRNGNVETVDFSLLLLGLDKIKQEAKQNLGGNDDLKRELDSKIESIIKEKEIKTVGEKISDLAETIAKSPEIERGSEIGIMAKRIELATEELLRQHPKEAEELKKIEFKKDFEEEVFKINPKLDENQLKTVKDYGELIAENSFGENILDGQKNEALETNSKIFNPGRLESAWTDLKGVVNFLQKSPEEIRGIKEKYNSLKEGLSGVNLPNLKEGRSFEKIMAGLNNPNTDQLFSRTKKYLGWADRVDKLTGGWLNKTVTDAGLKFASKIGNQAIQEFATNALGQIAQLGFKDGATAVLNGILSGGVNAAATTTAAGTAAGVAGGAAGTAAATAGTVAAEAAGTTAAVAGGAAVSATGVGAIVVAALAAVKVIKDAVGKMAEKLGINTKKFFEENFGKVGGKILGGIASVVALPALLLGSVSAVVVGPILILVFGGLFGYQMMQGSLVSSLVPPKGADVYESDIDDPSLGGEGSPPGDGSTFAEWSGVSVPMCNINTNTNAILRDIALSITGKVKYNQVCVKYMVLGPSKDWGTFCPLADNVERWPDVWGLDCAKYVDWVWYQCMEQTGRGRELSGCNSTCLSEKPVKDPANWKYIYPRSIYDLKIGDILHKRGHAAIYIGLNGKGEPEIMETVNSGYDPHVDLLTKIENFNVYQRSKVYTSVIRPINVFLYEN